MAFPQDRWFTLNLTVLFKAPMMSIANCFSKSIYCFGMKQVSLGATALYSWVLMSFQGLRRLEENDFDVCNVAVLLRVGNFLLNAKSLELFDCQAVRSDVPYIARSCGSGTPCHPDSGVL